MIGITGLGLSRVIRREFSAGLDCLGRRSYLVKLIKSVEIVNLLIAVSVLSLFYSTFSHYLANNWLNIQGFSEIIIEYAINLMAVSIVFQLIINVYIGSLYGFEKQIQANEDILFPGLPCENP